VLPALRGMSSSVALALASALLALSGAATAPQRPGLGERLAQVAVVVAVVAFVVELGVAQRDATEPGMMCLSLTTLIAIAVVIATFAGVAASRLPLRPWHRISLVTSGVLGGCTALWHHCAADGVVHVVVGHVVGPAIVGVVLALALARRAPR